MMKYFKVIFVYAILISLAFTISTREMPLANQGFENSRQSHEDIPNDWFMAFDNSEIANGFEEWNSSVAYLVADPHSGDRALLVSSLLISEAILTPSNSNGCGTAQLACESIKTGAGSLATVESPLIVSFYVKGNYYDFKADNASADEGAFDIAICQGEDITNICYFIYLKGDSFNSTTNRTNITSAGLETQQTSEAVQADPGISILTNAILKTYPAENGYTRVTLMINNNSGGMSNIVILMNSSDVTTNKDPAKQSVIILDDFRVEAILPQALAIYGAGELDFLDTEDIPIKVFALVIDTATENLEGDALLFVDIIRPNGAVIVSKARMTEQNVSGIYQYTFNNTIDLLNMPVGVYIAQINATPFLGNSTFGVTAFHIRQGGIFGLDIGLGLDQALESNWMTLSLSALALGLIILRKRKVL